VDCNILTLDTAIFEEDNRILKSARKCGFIDQEILLLVSSIRAPFLGLNATEINSKSLL